MSATPRVLGRLSIRSQIVALLLLAQIVAHALTFYFVSKVIVTEDRRAEVIADFVDALGVVLTVVPLDAVSGAPELRALVAADPRFRLSEDPPEGARPVQAGDPILTPIPPGWHARVQIGPEAGAKWPPAVRDPFELGVALSDGGWLRFTPEPQIVAQVFPRIAALLAIGLAAVTLTALVVWAGVAFVTPVRRLAEGAESFARDLDAPPLDEGGPREVRAATAAFNAMQARLRALVEARARTLASIGHDMRTPLTRLRLRLDQTELGEMRTGIERDVTTLSNLIDGALTFLASERQPLSPRMVDLRELSAQALADAERPHATFRLARGGPVWTSCDPDLTRRALDNLLDNAAKYAGGAEIALDVATDGAATVAVSDRGPGIAPELRAAVLRPFHRAESVAAGGPSHVEGFGLGLASASEIMERQGGRLELSDSDRGGLRAALIFPASGPRAA